MLFIEKLSPVKQFVYFFVSCLSFLNNHRDARYISNTYKKMQLRNTAVLPQNDSMQATERPPPDMFHRMNGRLAAPGQGESGPGVGVGGLWGGIYSEIRVTSR